ncbi:MAG: NUDIX domain-containing protein [Prevotella sp.]|nr:NUDIX domain-containing protein [Prevotella sp.]
MRHPLTLFSHCPVCGSDGFCDNDVKSRRCRHCGFVYYLNPSGATVALILNDNRELLVERRKNAPAKGTLDLPGGFSDMGETAEEGVAREVLEETGLRVTRARYLFSLPNEYLYSGMTIPTLDLFFVCEVASTADLRAGDDAAECFWVPLHDVDPQCFGLRSISQGVARFLSQHATPMENRE